MRLRTLIVSLLCCLVLPGCALLPPGYSVELTEAATALESAIDRLDEPAADAAFLEVVDLLTEDPSLTIEDGRTGAEVLLDSAALARERTEVPPNSCETCTEAAACGWTETECLAMFMSLYPEHERRDEVMGILAPGDLGMERVERYITQVMEKRAAAGSEE